MPLKQMPTLYCVGFALSYVTLFLYFLSFIIPNIWVQETVEMGSSFVTNRGLFSEPKICVGGHKRTKWNCYDMRESSGPLSAFLVVLAAVVQAVACVMIFYTNTNSRKPDWYAVVGHPITYCGLASGISYTGLLLYTRYSFQGENITFGWGFTLNAAGVVTGYVSTVLTSLYNYKTV